MSEQWNEDREREIRRARKKRIEEMKREKRRVEMRRRFLIKYGRSLVGAGVACLCLMIAIAVAVRGDDTQDQASLPQGDIELQGDITAQVKDYDAATVGSGNETGTEEPETVETFLAQIEQPLVAVESDQTRGLGEDIISNYAVLIDLETNQILAERNANTRMNPASMTKILTILTAAEHLTEADLDDTFTITLDITDYSFIHDCSDAGFLENEVVTVRDLFYGTVLPSGGDAAVALATYVAGSQDAFVELMNEELVKLGISDSAHFTNCVGVYDKEHYCTVYDMAVILKAAIDNEFCKEVLSAHTDVLSTTVEHPEGIPLSNWFLRRIEDHVEGYEVVAAKTGYVTQSGNCAASYAEDANGNGYICVTGNANSGWRCIYDHVAIYDMFLR